MLENRYALQLVTAPTSEPITLDEAKSVAKIEYDDDDTLITWWIKEGREALEKATGLQLLPATWRIYLDSFPATCFYLPKPPVRAVSSVKYLDSDGVQQTLAASDYLVDIYSQPARIQPAYGKSWPSTRAQPNAVEITFSSGFDPDELPHQAKSYCSQYVVLRNEQRSPVVTGTIVSEINFALESLAMQLSTGVYV